MSLYKDASLAMIPSAYKDGKLYSIRPTDGSGDFTFSRGSNLAATRVDVNGLIEKGRENLLPYSNTFDQWSPKRGTLSQGVTDPFGGNNAWSLTAIDIDPYIYNQTAWSGVVTLSIWAKGVGSSIGKPIQLRMGGSFKEYTLTGDWQRFEHFANGSAANIGIEVPNPAVAGDVVHIYGAQLELGLVATDYIETGASTAQAGILEDMPRLDYSGGASCPSLLLEPQRRNIVTDSEYLDGTGWGLVAATASLEDVTTPDGGSKAYKVTANNNSGGRIQYNLGTFGNDLIYSAFFKGTGDATLLRIRNNQVSANEVIYNIDEEGNFTFNSEDALDDVYGIESYSNGWNRIYFKTDTSGSASNYLQIRVDHQDGDGSVYIWGAQVEDNGTGGDVSYPTSYIPTYGSSVTRSVDSCVTSSMSDVVGLEQGTFFVEVSALDNDGTFRQMTISNGTNDNRISIDFTNTNNQIRCYIEVDDVSQGSMTASVSDITESHKIAVKYIDNDFALWVDGTKQASNTNASVPTGLDRLRFDNSTNSNKFFGKVKQSTLFPTALTDTELAALTTL